MTRAMSASKARGNIFNLVDETAITHQPIKKKGTVSKISKLLC